MGHEVHLRVSRCNYVHINSGLSHVGLNEITPKKYMGRRERFVFVYIR